MIDVIVYYLKVVYWPGWSFAALLLNEQCSHYFVHPGSIYESNAYVMDLFTSIFPQLHPCQYNIKHFERISR